MKNFRTLFWILGLSVWLLSLFILIEAMIVNFPGNPFWPHRFIIGVGFIALTGFLRIAYKKTKKRS